MRQIENHSDRRCSLAGLSLEQVGRKLGDIGMQERIIPMRACQVRRWAHHFGLGQFADMTDIDKRARLALTAAYTLERPRIDSCQTSRDGARKWLVRFDDEATAETVFIPGVGKAGAACLSCQIGCSLTCSFCRTGTQKRLRNLSAQEMVAQLLIVRDSLDEWPAPKEGRRLSNVVFMGMGEPLYNLDNLVEAIHTISDGEGIAIGARRITVSTAGVAPKIPELGERSRAMLAISLHAVRDDLRSMLVPLNRKYDIQTLLEAVRAYPRLSNARRVTFEYVMLDEVNDSPAEARDLIRLLTGIPAKINLIPFNSWPGAPYRCSPPERIAAFAAILKRAGYASPVRTPRGQDILAACGQLRTSELSVIADGTDSADRIDGTHA